MNINGITATFRYDRCCRGESGQLSGPGAMDSEALEQGRVGFKATGDPSDLTRLTLTTIRRELERVVRERSAQDENLHYLDGRELYGEADFAELPLPDPLHPDTATHHRVGERFADRVFGQGGPFARASPTPARGSGR